MGLFNCYYYLFLVFFINSIRKYLNYHYLNLTSSACFFTLISFLIKNSFSSLYNKRQVSLPAFAKYYNVFKERFTRLLLPILSSVILLF